MEIGTLLPQLQDTLSEIQNTVSGLSSKKQQDEIERLEQERENRLAELRSKFEKEQQEVLAKRQAELESIKQKRKQEDERREARRRKEDEEWKAAVSNDDSQRRQRYNNEATSIEHKTTQQKEELEESVRKAIQEGKQRLRELDERRKELNQLIDEQLAQPLPPPPRKRHRSKQKPGDPPKDEPAGGPASAGSKGDDSTDNTSDPSAKRLPPSPAPSPAKTPDSKKDGELPSQARSNRSRQAARKPAGDLPTRSAAAQNDVSNESKGKPELAEPSSDRSEQSGNGRDIRGSNAAELARREKTKKQNSTSENGISGGHTAGKAASQGREISNETDDPEVASRKDNPPTHQSEGEGYTVDSQPALQPAGLSSAPETGAPGQDGETNDQVGLNQAAIPDSRARERSESKQGVRENMTGPRQASHSPSEPTSSRTLSQGQQDLAPSNPNKPDVPQGPGTKTESEDFGAEHPDYNRKRLISPLPVENQTVWGHDQLFDDDRRASRTSGSHSTDEHSDSPPHGPVGNHDVPVLPEPTIPPSLDDQGLTKLTGDLGARGRQMSRERLAPRLEEMASLGKRGVFERPVRETISNGNTSRGLQHPEVVRPFWQQSAHQSRSTLEQFDSPGRLGLQDDNDGRPFYSLHATSGDWESDTPHARLPHGGVERSLPRSKQRGRQKTKSSCSQARAVNPREEMFQGCREDINIRGDWFKRSKRGLS